MQSSQVRNVGLPSCADTKRDVPAWTQDPKIFPLDWFSISRPNIIRQTKEYVSELSKWRNCPKIKTLSKLKAVLKRIMMFLHTHISYIDGKSLLECDLEEDLITLVSLYMDMELRVLLIKKSATSGATTSIGPGSAPGNDSDSARNDKLVSDRISYWLYTVLTGHEQRVDALLSTTVYTRHTRPVLDPIFRKVLSEMPDGPFSNVSYVRNMLAYKTWRERTLVADDVVSEELNTRILQQLVPRDYAFPSPLLRCLGKGENARDHARPHNVNLADACRNFMRYCREIPATAAEQINFESIPLLDDEMLGDEENEVNNLMNMISSRKQRKTASASPRNSIQVDAFIDLTLPKSKTKSASSRANPSSFAGVIDLTEEDEKPMITAPTSVVVESSSAAPSRVVSTVQRINASKKPQVTQECSYALTPSAPQVETRCFTAYRDQDIYLVNISCMCPVRAHRQRECQCQDKKGGHYKENKALKTSITERKYEKDATFVGRCFQFSIGNQYAYPSEDDVDTEIEPLVVGNSQDQVKLEMRSSTAVTCNTNEDTTQDETTEFCDKLFSASLNHCDCDGCKKQDTNLSRYENRTCASDKSSHESANELSDNEQCKVTCTQRVPHPTSVADMYAMEKANPIVLQSQQTAILPGNESNLEHFSETLDKRKVQYSDIHNTKISKDNFVQNTENLSSNCLNEIRKIKLPVVDKIIEDSPDKFEPPVVNENVFTVRINSNTPSNTYEEIVECSKESLTAVIPANSYEKCRQLVIPHISEETLISTVSTSEETTENRKFEKFQSIEDISNNTLPTNTCKKSIECDNGDEKVSNAISTTSISAVSTSEETTEYRKIENFQSIENISNNTLPTNTYEKSIECDSGDEKVSNAISTNTNKERTECEENEILHCSEDITHNTISSATNEETTLSEKVVLHISEDNSNSTMLTNIEDATECNKDVTLHTNENYSSNTILVNTIEESSESEQVVLPKSTEENITVMSKNITEEVAVTSLHSEEDFAQSTNISTENIEPQNALITDIEVHTESTNTTAETTSFDISTLQEQVSFLPNAQNESLSPESNSETEIERLCNEITQLGCSITPDIDQSEEKDSNEEFLQTDLLDETSTSESKETIPDIKTVHLDRNSEEVPAYLEQSIYDDSTQNIETTVEEIAENNEHFEDVTQSSSNSNELKEIENIVETSITTEESAAKEELPNDSNLLEIENELPDNTNAVNPVADNCVQQLAPEIVIESEIVVESVPDICEITTLSSVDNPIENVESIGCNTELSFDETTTVTQDLHEVVPKTVNNTDSNDVEPEENIVNEITSVVVDAQKNEAVVSSKNDEETILSPRKRRRRKLNLNINKLIDEEKPEEQSKEILVTTDSLNDGISDKTEERKSLYDSISADNLPEEPKSIKPLINELEDTQDISTTCQENSSDNTNLPSLSEEIVSNNTNPIETIIEDTVSVQSSQSERPKRRRKQNLKNIREEKLTISVEDNLTVPQNQNKELVIVCKNLSLNEIENLRKNKSQTLFESSSITEERDTSSIHLNVANQLNEDISTPNLNIIETLPQPVILNEVKIEKSETDLNTENNNANIENPENPLQLNNKETPKQGTIKIKSRRKSLVDNISDKITVDQVINSTLVEALPITKLKRPRGRPSKLASRKLKFFSENLNLHNLDSSKNNATSDIVTTSDKLSTNAQLELSDEDVPLAYRVSQSLPQKRNSVKYSNKILDKIRLSDAENELMKSEDELPLSARKQKTKSTKQSKNYSSTETITKPKSFREKLQMFKFQARDKSEIIENSIQKEEPDMFTLKKFNTEIKPKKAVKTYSNTRALKTPKIFSVPEIIQASTIKPSKSNLEISPVKPKKCLRFASEVTMINYNEEDILHPQATKNIDKSKNSNVEEGKILDSSLHRAEQIKIKKFREMSDKTDLLSLENSKLTNKIDNVIPAEINTKTAQENKYSDISTDLKSSTKNKEIKAKSNFDLPSKKMLSKKARDMLFPETDKNYREKGSQIINNIKVENVSSFEEKIEMNNTFLPESSSLEYKENESSIKIRKHNEQEIVNIDQKENSFSSPIELKTDKQISSKDEEQGSKIIPKTVPIKRRSKFSKLKLKRSLSSPKKLQNNIDSPPKKVTQFKKKNKIQLRLNGSNSKTQKVTSRRKSNKTKSNINVLQQDVTLNLECESKEIPPDSNKNSVIDTIQKEENQNVEITKNISLQSLENESTELINISPDKVEDKTDSISENIESANINSDMLYKPSNKIYEKNFEFYSDQDDVSNSELVIDTSAESSDAEDTKVESKLKINEINQQIHNKVPDVNQTKYHHSIAEIVNIPPVENNTTKDNLHVSAENCINTESDDIEKIVVYQSKSEEHQDIEKSDKKIEEIELTILFRENEHQKENNSNDDKFDHSLISVSEETVIQENNSEEQQKNVLLNPSEEIIENNTFQENILSHENSVKHQESSIDDNICDSSSISIVKETVIEDMIIDESLITNEDPNNTVFDKNIDLQNTVEEKPNECVKQNKFIIEEHTAEISEISEEIYNELNIEKIIEEKAQQLSESYAPSVEMLMNIEIGFESCTFSQDKPLQPEHAKEGCVKCSVNGKHRDNKRVKVQGTHQYKENAVEECLEENSIIPAIAYCQAVEILEPNLCICTAKVETTQVLTNDSPIVDNYNLCILADIAMSSIHLNTKTENNNVIQITGEGSNNMQSQGPLQKDERCVFVTFPDNAPTSSKPATDISVIDSNNEEISVNVQKIAGGFNSKGSLLENKIQVLTERAKNGTKINGENLDELYKSLENICEFEIDTLTRSTPKLNCHASVPIPIETPPVNPKITEPNITIDIPNTALLHLTPDDDDFLIRNEPFSLQMPVVQSLETIKTSAEPQIEKENIDTTVVKKLYNELESITIDQKTPNNENENCESPKETEQVTKTKSKKGRSKSKTSNSQNSEASYLLNKYKSNQDSNKNTDTNNQQISNSSKNNNSSPPSYIRSTRPMRMVTTRKRNVNVLDNNCPPDEPAKKVSASEKMFDKLLEEHRKELLSEAKLQNTKDETAVDKNVENVQTVSDTTMPILDDIPETPIISAPVVNTEESNIPLPVLDYEKQEPILRNEEIEPTKIETSNDIAEHLETITSTNDQKDVNEEKLLEEKILEEPALETPVENEKELVHEQTQSENTKLSNTAEISEEITIPCTEIQIEKNTEEQIEEEEVDRNASAIEVVQDWFSRVDDNKAQSESYTDITSIQTIEECNFFEEISSTSENSPNARKSDDKVFSENQTPDSGIAFDEDSVQKDKSVPENLSDGETYCPTEPAITKTYFCNLNQSDGVKQIEISDIKLIKPSKSSEMNKMELKVSIELERIKDILPLLTKYTPERKFKKRKEHITETDKTKKRKYSLDETHVNIVSEQSSNNTLIKDYKFKKRKHSNDDNILQECVIENVMSPAGSQRDISSSIRTKGSVKEYPDCLFGITESPVPSGSFHSPYPSDISITEEPAFYEEGGIDLCNDYPCYDSFEVLQEQQSLQREYNVVDDNPKDVQQGLQAGYCVVDSQFLPLSEYMNDGDYILIDNKIFNDKRMVPVNMHQVQPETKPHNPEEVKRSEFDDSEKEDSLSETVDEIIKNPSLFSEQTASEVQVISMDQATSEVQVVIACDNFQETEMTDSYLFGIALQNEITSSETPLTSVASDIQPTPMELDETTTKNKENEKSVKLSTPKEDAQFNNISTVSQPAMELLTAVNSISESVGAQHIENNKEISKETLSNTYDMDVSGEKTEKICARKLSTEESAQKNFASHSPTSRLTTETSSIENSSKTFQTSCYLKPSTPYKQGISDAKEINKSSKQLEPNAYSSKTPDKNVPIMSPYRDQKKYDHQHGIRINSKNTYPDHKPHASIQKPLKNDPITSHYVSPASQKLNDSKVHSKQYSPKTYRAKVPPDAFDKLKQDRPDITPPASRTRYHSSASDPNFMKNRYRKDTASDYHRRHSFDRRSPRLRQSSQGSSDSRRPQSAYTEPSPKPFYRLPPSDPTHRSSQYNNKKPDPKTSQSRTESKHSQSASSAHKDWLKNENLLNLIKTANTIYSKKY